MEKFIVDAWYKVHPKMLQDGEINREIAEIAINHGGLIRVAELDSYLNQVTVIGLPDGTELDARTDFSTDLSAVLTQNDLETANVMYSHMNQTPPDAAQDEINKLEQQIQVLTELLAEKQNRLNSLKTGEAK